MKRLASLSLVVFLLLAVSCLVVFAQSGEATITRNLNFRDAPSIHGRVLQKLTFGSKYPVLSRTASSFWYQLDVDGVDGWVCANYVSLDVQSSSIPVDTNVANEDCKGKILSPAIVAPDNYAVRNYRAIKQYSPNGNVDYAIIDISQNNKVLFVTNSEYPGSTNDVKAGAFNADHTMFAAAYHYSPAYTWIGVWSVPDGKFLYSVYKDGFWYSVNGAFTQ